METINFVSAPQKKLYFTVWLTWQLTEFEARFELAVFIASEMLQLTVTSALYQ